MYLRSIVYLWASGKISMQTAWHALTARPLVVSGKRNGYVVIRSNG
jgi:hypothetical protein